MNWGNGSVVEHSVARSVSDGNDNGAAKDSWSDDSDYAVNVTGSGPKSMTGDQTHTIVQTLTVSGNASGNGLVTVKCMYEFIEFYWGGSSGGIVLDEPGWGRSKADHEMEWFHQAGSANSTAWDTTQKTSDYNWYDDDSFAEDYRLPKKTPVVMDTFGGMGAWSMDWDSDAESWIQCKTHVNEDTGTGTNLTDAYVDGWHRIIIAVVDP